MKTGPMSISDVLSLKRNTVTRLQERPPLAIFAYVLFFFLMVSSLQFLAFVSSNDFFAELLFAPPNDIRSSLGDSDAGSYIQGGIDLANGVIPEEHAWILLLWPPGMSVLYGIFIAVGLPVGASMGLLTVASWSLVGAFLGTLLIRGGSWLSAILFSWLWLFSPLTSEWILASGFLYSEMLGSLSAAAFVIALWLLGYNRPLRRFPEPHLLWAVLAGFSLVGVAYFRIAALPAVLLVLAIAFFAALLCAGSYMRDLFRSGPSLQRMLSRERPKRALDLSSLMCFIIAGLLAFLPWVCFRAAINEPITAASNPINAGDYMWAQRWITDEQFSSAGAGWLVDGDANWACDLDPSRCQTLNELAVVAGNADFPILREAALQVVLEQPIPFLIQRGRVIASAWLSTPGTSPLAQDVGWYGISLVLLMISGVVLAVRKGRMMPALAVLPPIFILATVSTLLIAHVETRYFLPTQVVVLTWWALLVAAPGKGVMRDACF